MNPLENQLQSWTPRRPSPKIARRLFGPAEKPWLGLPRRAGTWNWLSPVAACALTMLVAVHTASRAPGRLAVGSNATIFASIALNAASFSNSTTFSLSQMDENLEYNVWPHATRHLPMLPRAETPPRRDFGNLIPTNF
jgi:hypothetical protein